MANLPTAERIAVSAKCQSDICRARETLGALTKAEFQAAVDAADSWANSNAASYNTALPLPARTALTAAQKARILMEVIRRRYELGA